MSRARRSGRKTPFICWIRSLINKGLQPSIHPIEDTPQVYGDEAEIYWIKSFKESGCALLNFSDGGNMCGFIGKTHTPEMRKYLSERAKGRRHKPEVIARIAAKNRGRKQSEEEKERRAVKLRGLKRSTAQRKAASIRMKADDRYKKPVIQIDKGGSEVAKFRSVTDACEKTGAFKTNIIRAAKNPLVYSCCGFFWRYA